MVELYGGSLSVEDLAKYCGMKLSVTRTFGRCDLSRLSNIFSEINNLKY